MEEIMTETVYEGSVLCPKCGHFLTPLEAIYSHRGLCPDCRNMKYTYHAKRGMA